MEVKSQSNDLSSLMRGEEILQSVVTDEPNALTMIAL